MAFCLRVQLSRSRSLCRLYCNQQNGWRAENSSKWSKALSASGLLLVTGTASWLAYQNYNEKLVASVHALAPPTAKKNRVNIVWFMFQLVGQPIFEPLPFYRDADLMMHELGVIASSTLPLHFLLFPRYMNSAFLKFWEFLAHREVCFFGRCQDILAAVDVSWSWDCCSELTDGDDNSVQFLFTFASLLRGSGDS